MGSTTMRALVVGPRRGLCRALAREAIPHVVWTASESRWTSAERVHRAPIAVGEKAARRQAEALASHGPFTHVIAGTEASVVPAAVARRVLGARVAPRSMVLRCHDKLLMKRHLADRGIPMASFLAPGAAAAETIVARLGLPVVIKPRAMSGGRGMTIARTADELDSLRRDGLLLEAWVDAAEVSVESFVHHGRILLENVTEYARKGHLNVVPAALDPETRDRVLELNRRVIGALGIQWGMTHLEAYLAPDAPLFGEIALRPPGGYIMELLELAWGFDAWRTFVAVEIDRPVELPATPRAHAAALVLHPGPGTVAGTEGLETVRRMPGVVEARLKVRAGDRIPPRTGLGDDVGFVLARARGREELLDVLATVEERLRIILA